MGELYLLLATVFACTCLFGVGGTVFVALARLIVHASLAPFKLYRWWTTHREATRRLHCLETLARFSSVLGTNNRAHDYFAFLVNSGIRPQALRNVLEENYQHARESDFERRFQMVLRNIQARTRIHEFANRQEALLAEGHVQLERLRFQEQALGGLFHQIRAKYEV